MNTEVLEKRFAEMGARVRINERGMNPRQRFGRFEPTRGFVTIDIVNDKKGELFTINLNPTVELSVANIDPKDRHLLLVANQEGDKSKFLCGHDERHWFVAAVPESAPNVTTVAKAKEALRPDSLQDVSRRLRKKDRYSRRNSAYKRQGEWFFTPAPGFEPPAHLIHKNEPITRGRGKPHTVEFLYREPGATVYVARSFRSGENRTISASQFERLTPAERKGGAWRAQTSVSVAYAKGRISHADHATIVLDGWHRIEMNSEQRARAMSSVLFVD